MLRRECRDRVLTVHVCGKSSSSHPDGLLPPQGSGPEAGNPRRHPNVPRVNKKYRMVVVLVCENFLDLTKIVRLSQQPRKLGLASLATSRHDFIPSFLISFQARM